MKQKNADKQAKELKSDHSSQFIVGRDEILKARQAMVSGESNALTNSKVEDFMLPKAGLVSLEPETPLPHAYEIIQDRQLDSLPITEEGRLVGIITKDTLERYLPGTVPQTDLSNWQSEQTMTQTAVSDAMDLNPTTISPGTTIQSAADIMLRKKIDTIPVTDQEEMLVGLIRLRDILHMVAQS